MTKKIVLGITGGVAAYKSAELTRLLIKAGMQVQVVMTEAACQFITPTTLQALSGKPVYTNMWASDIDNGMPHIELSRDADAILIAPASADFIAKLVHGGADDLLSTLCLARDCALLVAPAMNKQMWENPATQRNIKQLQEDGITVLGPDAGEQACGEVGVGRMLEPEALLAEVTTHFTPKLLAGKKVMITAGATREMIDPVRAITNLSSGKMGYALAQIATQMGAEVTLVSGHTALTPPKTATYLTASSAGEMYDAVMQTINTQDVFIAVAAVSDYTPQNPATQKIKKTADRLNITLEKTKDILASVASLDKPPFCVGFAAESEQVTTYAAKKRKDKNIPLIVANDVSVAMGSDHNQVTLIDDDGEHPMPLADKNTVAEQILTHLAKVLPR